jgi:hypothetical protein
MAKQKSTVQLQGTIGNLTFYKSIDGFMVKAKSEVSRDKILSDPRFERTRENMAEFAGAASSARIIRQPFTPLLQSSADPRMVSRFNALCFKIAKTDPVSKRGSRMVANGSLALFYGFDFNNRGMLSTILPTPYTITFTRTTGNVQLDLAAFIPKQGVAAPQGATHFQLQMAAAAINFSAQKNTAIQAASDVLPWDNNPAPAFSLTASLPANVTDPVFVLLQIQFMEQLNGGYYSLQNGGYNACSIIEVDAS